VQQLTRLMAIELAPHSVRVNAIGTVSPLLIFVARRIPRSEMVPNEKFI
jgi:hypothetical protein